MFWNKVAPLYDAFETLLNKRVYNGTGKAVAEEICSTDTVLECASGTGSITKYIAPVCRRLTATDMSAGMLRQKLDAAERNRRFIQTLVQYGCPVNRLCALSRKRSIRIR